MEPLLITPEQADALEVARSLARAGIPIFVAPPSAFHKIGFQLPEGWQQTIADPDVVDTWRPGMALCAVMGHGLDLLDIDPRGGGDLGALNGCTPRYYGVAATPSGGIHLFIRSLSAGSRDRVFPGIDVKGGLPDGGSRGFAFLAPTERASKVDGVVRGYSWAQVPDLAGLAGAEDDRSGEGLAARIRELKASSGSGRTRRSGGPDWWQKFMNSSEAQSEGVARRVIGEKLADVAGWTPVVEEGFRDVLMDAAYTLGGYVGGGWLDETEARARLLEAVCGYWPAADEDDELWIEQGLTDGREAPFYVHTEAEKASQIAEGVGPSAEPPVGDVSAGGPPPVDFAPLLEAGEFDPVGMGSDQQLAEAVAVYVQPLVRLAIDTGQWIVRQPERWIAYPERASWVVSTVAKRMPDGVRPVPKEIDQRTAEHWQADRKARFEDSGRSAKIERKLKAVMQNRYLGGVELGHLDANPEVLWAGGWPFDLRKSGVAPVVADIDPATPHLHTARCLPDVRPTPCWDRFLAVVWPDAEVRSWALRVLAIALTGYADAALPVLYGEERNGKTSVVALLMDALGTYGISADPKLLAGADNSHSSIIYALKGVRLAFIDEGPRRGHVAQERLKQLTGGGQLTGNAMRKDPVTFTATHTLIMTSNDEPPITDPALRARIRAIYCAGNRAEVRAARVALTPAVWAREVPGVLASMMREAAAWLIDRDSAQMDRAPAVLQGAVEEMAAGQDPVRHWVENRTVPADPGTPGRELYVAFADWHQTSPLYRKLSVPSETAFGRSLSDQGYPPRKTGGKWFRGLSVLGGPAGVAPWEPLPSAHMTPGYGETNGNVAGSAPGQAGYGGSVATPANPENGRSTPISSSFFGGLAGIPTTIHPKNNNYSIRATEETYTEEIGKIPARPASEAPGTPSDLGKRDWRDTRHEAAIPPPNLEPPQSDETKPTQSPSVTKPREGSLHPQRAEIAKRADEQKITKAAARAALKAEQIAEAIREAQGEVLSLPAVVDRAGHVIPVTVDQAAALVRSALERTAGRLTVDVETTGYPVGHQLHALRSVQLGDKIAAAVFDPVAHADLVRALLAEATWLHAHSATADLVPMAVADLIDIESGWDRMLDTVIPAKLADPQSTGSDPGLKKLAEAVLRTEATAPAADEARERVFKAGKWLTRTKSDTPIERSGWAQIEISGTTMLRYAASDVLDTAYLAERLPPVDPAVLERERIAEAMTARIAYSGLKINADRVAALTTEHTELRELARTRVREFGIENPGSGPQVAAALAPLGARLPVSEKGNPSVAEDVLTRLRRSEPDSDAGRLAAAVLDYRHSNTVLGLFLDPYRLLCELGDGRARPTVYTLGTDTGRMSCVRPNFQQLPKKGGVRSVVVADPGMCLISADFSGVEIRGAAALSQDPVLLEVLAQGRDLHAEVALQAFGPDDEATRLAGRPAPSKENRYAAKAAVFGRLYGGGVATLAKQVGVSEIEMQAIIASLDNLTPGLSAWSNQIRTGVRQGKTQFRSYSGRIIHFPREFPHKAPNYAIQGSCRELLVDALVRWRDTRWGKCTLLPIHDELIVMVPAEDVNSATEELKRCMESELYGVKIISDPGDRKKWGSSYWMDAT